MDELTDVELLQRYRRDRYDLLNFILSADILKEVIVPPGALSLEDVDLDQVNVEFVLECARIKGTLELSKAIKKQYLNYKLLPKVTSGSRNVYFLVTDPEFSGPAPSRIPPPITTKSLSSFPEDPSQASPLQSRSLPSISITEGIDLCGDLEEDESEENVLRRKVHDSTDLALSLPPFATGLTDDDLRETAYEVLLASVGGAVGLISPAKDRRDENKSNPTKRFPRGVNGTYHCQPVRTPGLAGLLETMRIQMQISKSTDRRTREALLRAAAGRIGKRMDTLLIPLELLFVVSPEDFRNKKDYIHWKKRQLNLLEEGIANHPAVSLEDPDRMGSELRFLIAKVEETQGVDAAGEAHAEALRALQAYANILAERARDEDQMGEFCHWADGYHLNVQLYEMLLCSVFDVVDEGKIVEEVEEILELLKSTWRVLGISQTVHDVCYTWVLFRQFVLTGEEAILYIATQQMQRIASAGQRCVQERIYMKTLCSTVETDGFCTDLTYVHSLLIPIKFWADKRLGDYHLHFPQALDHMEALVTVAVVTSRLIADETDQSVDSKDLSTAERAAGAKQVVKEYICSSIQCAYERALDAVNVSSEKVSKHPLVLLAEYIQELAKKDASIFAPILSRWNHRAVAISASHIHDLYQKDLKPFLDKISDLTDEVESVLSAADTLEEYLRGLVLSVSREGNICQQHLVPYQLEVVAGHLVMRWVDIQLKKVNDSVQQSISNEDWTPISTELRYGKSILDVFKILKETMDQFLSLRLPLRITQLRNIVDGLDGTLQLYCNCILSQLGTVADLIPPVPSLRRHKKENIVKAFSKTKAAEPKVPDKNNQNEERTLSTMTHCICLNTLHYILYQVDSLEDSIKERWGVKSPNIDICFNSGGLSRHRPSGSDLRLRRPARISEEFSVGFDNTRKVATLTLEKVCEFTGIKIIFCDMRESFIDGLYKGSVLSSRIENVINGLDLVLGELIEAIVEPIRDRVVMGLLQASLNGFLRVMLDGGPSRAFSQSDVDMLEEDLKALKDFFIADGDGLPSSFVEIAADTLKQVLELYRYQTRVVIEYFKRASEHVGTACTPQKNAKTASGDVDILLRVLCHRTDRDASQFLKKHYKLPKS
eukprot:Gb_29552 [translate_table: standard]